MAVNISFPEATFADANVFARELRRELIDAGVPASEISIKRSHPDNMDLGELIHITLEGLHVLVGIHSAFELGRLVYDYTKRVRCHAQIVSTDPGVDVSAEASSPFRIGEVVEQIVEHRSTTEAPRHFGLIFLGASRFTHRSDLNRVSFAASKERIASVLTQDNLLADSVHRLDLFDFEIPPSQLVDHVHSFLTDHRELTDLIIYYCGHGSFLPPDRTYYLMLRSTKPDREANTGLQLRQFQIDLDELLRDKRTFLVLDCCYAAAALRDWMSDRSVAGIIADQVEALFPPHGTALLAAASRNSPAIAPEDRATTLFSGHLADVIREGIPTDRKRLTLADLAEGVRRRIRREPLTNRVLPELYAPRQSEGDVSSVPLVLNRFRSAAAQPAKPQPNREMVPPRLDVESPPRRYSQASSPMPQEGRLAPEQTSLAKVSAVAVDKPAPAHPDIAPTSSVSAAAAALAAAAAAEQASAECPSKEEAPAPFHQPANDTASTESAWSSESLSGPAVSDQKTNLTGEVESPSPSAGPSDEDLPFVSLAALAERMTQDTGAAETPAADRPGASQPSLLARKSKQIAAGIALVVLVAGFGAAGIWQSWFSAEQPSASQLQPGPPPAGQVAMGQPSAGDAAGVRANSCSATASLRDPKTGLGGPDSPVRIQSNLPDPKALRSIAISPDGSRFATAGDDGVVRLWTWATFQLERALAPDHQAEAYSVSFSSDGSLIASAGHDGMVRVWNAASGALEHEYAARSDGNIVKQYGVVLFPGSPLRYVDAVGDDGTLQIWDVINNAYVSRKLVHADNLDRGKRTIRSISIPKDSHGEYATAGFDGKVEFVPNSGKPITIDAFAGKALSVALSPDGTRIAAAGRDDKGETIKVWKLANKNLTVFKGHPVYAIALAWSADGNRILSGGGAPDATVRLWDANTGKPIRSFAGHTKDVEAVAFHPNKNRLISASMDGTIKLWDPQANEPLVLTAAVFGRDNRGEYVVYAPNGCYSGTLGVERLLKLESSDGGKTVQRPVSSADRDALSSQEYITALIAGR